MSEPEGEGQMWDAPNQQVVRGDASAPWEEGTGGETEEPVEKTTTKTKKKTTAADDDEAGEDE